MCSTCKVDCSRQAKQQMLLPLSVLDVPIKHCCPLTVSKHHCCWHCTSAAHAWCLQPQKPHQLTLAANNPRTTHLRSLCSTKQHVMCLHARVVQCQKLRLSQVNTFPEHLYFAMFTWLQKMCALHCVLDLHLGHNACCNLQLQVTPCAATSAMN